MRIAVDVMGFENEISEAILAIESFTKLHEDLEVVIVGDETKIKKFLKVPSNRIEVVHTDQFVTQDDSIFSLRIKNNSSMQVAANLLKDNKVDGLLSAGNSSIFVFIMYSTIGLLPGINKLGFMPTIPTIDGKVCNMIDVGANIDCSPEDLTKFAIMASIYASQRTKNPSIAILANGTEHHKGRQLEKETAALLEKTSLNYIGYIEANKIFNHIADVIVTDGYTGNLVLKALEGTGKVMSDFLKLEYKKPINIFASLLSLPIFKKMKKTFDYKENAGAFVLGLNKICVKTHGSADKQQFLSSLRMLYNTVKNNVIINIKNEIAKYEQNK